MTGTMQLHMKIKDDATHTFKPKRKKFYTKKKRTYTLIHDDMCVQCSLAHDYRWLADDDDDDENS